MIGAFQARHFELLVDSLMGKTFDSYAYSRSFGKFFFFLERSVLLASFFVVWRRHGLSGEVFNPAHLIVQCHLQLDETLSWKVCYSIWKSLLDILVPVLGLTRSCTLWNA